jgi:hypothetical protein
MGLFSDKTNNHPGHGCLLFLRSNVRAPFISLRMQFSFTPIYFHSYGAVVQSVVPGSPAAACGIVPGTNMCNNSCMNSRPPATPGSVICKVNGAILPCNRGSTAVFDSIKRGLVEAAASPTGITLTVIHPHSPFPFSRSSEVSRSHGGSRAKLSRSQSSGLPNNEDAASAGVAGVGEVDDEYENVGDVEMNQDVGRTNASISKGRALPSGAVDLTVKVTPLGLGFMPSKILVSREFDCT